MTTADDLRQAAGHFFIAHAADFGLQADAIEVTHVLNPGGFVNFSYRISDGRTHLFAKLSTAEHRRGRLEAWQELDPLLRPHRAPPVLAAVDLGSAAGLVFPWLPGRSPVFGPEVIRSVLAVAVDLWADDELADRLRDRATVMPGGPPTRTTAANSYFDNYHDRFTADLAEIASNCPPFVDPAVLDFMRGEVDAMERRVRDSSAFQEDVTTPVHGDLWLNNVLWESAESWWLLDWDNVQIGDPAIDLAMLTGPAPSDLRPLKRLDLVKEVAPPDIVERLGLLGQASLLDWVIDPLADWLEADAVPDQADEARPEKERLHREALALYREVYGKTRPDGLRGVRSRSVRRSSTPASPP